MYLFVIILTGKSISYITFVYQGNRQSQFQGQIYNKKEDF